jgi:hypothetical protein
VTQSAETYQSIKAVIESANAPYSNRSVSSFLQGSYGNDTNVRGVESDVDIVLKTSSIYYPDLQKLPDDQKAHYKRVHTDATYSQEEFRTDVSSWLQKQYGADFDPGEKALTINANGNRRSADVLACSHARFRARVQLMAPDVPGATMADSASLFAYVGLTTAAPTQFVKVSTDDGKRSVGPAAAVTQSQDAGDHGALMRLNRAGRLCLSHKASYLVRGHYWLGCRRLTQQSENELR